MFLNVHKLFLGKPPNSSPRRVCFFMFGSCAVRMAFLVVLLLISPVAPRNISCITLTFCSASICAYGAAGITRLFQLMEDDSILFIYLRGMSRDFSPNLQDFARDTWIIIFHSTNTFAFSKLNSPSLLIY